jgi:hypothetical protein
MNFLKKIYSQDIFDGVSQTIDKNGQLASEIFMGWNWTRKISQAFNRNIHGVLRI